MAIEFDRPHKEHPSLSLDLARKVNNACGAELADETELISLSGPGHFKRRVRWAEKFPNTFEKPVPSPQSWVEFMQTLEIKERTAINRVINRFASSGLTLGELRNGDTDTLLEVWNVGVDSVIFALTMFKKPEENKTA